MLKECVVRLLACLGLLLVAVGGCTLAQETTGGLQLTAVRELLPEELSAAGFGNSHQFLQPYS
jgi:hypothetical protein